MHDDRFKEKYFMYMCFIFIVCFFPLKSKDTHEIVNAFEVL